MTLPAGYTSPLFRHLSEREYRVIDDFWKACQDYDWGECGQWEWFEVLYDSDPRKLPLIHLTFLVCVLIDDKVPQVSGYTHRWSDEGRSSDFGPKQLGSLPSEVGGFTKDQWTSGRINRSNMRKICNKLKGKLGRSWPQDIKSAEKRIIQDLLSLHTQESPGRNIRDFKAKSAALEGADTMGPLSFARYSIWDDIVKGKIEPFTTEHDYWYEVGRREKEFFEIQDPEHERWLPDNEGILGPVEISDVLHKYYPGHEKYEDDSYYKELKDRWEERGYSV